MLKRRHTRFGPSSKEGTPESDESIDTSSPPGSNINSPNKLRKILDRDVEPPYKMPVILEDGDEEDPWKGLVKWFTLSLDDCVTLARRKDGLVVALRQLSGPGTTQKLKMLRKIQHKNFLLFLDYISFEGSSYIVMEHKINAEEKLSVTLRQYALIVPEPTEEQLATILGQVSLLYFIWYILT